MKRTDIENAKRGIVIHVPANISNRTKNPDNCAFAKACRLLETVEDAAVYVSTAYLKFKNQEKWKRYRVLADARREIIKFDRTGKFSPGSYKLGVIQASHQAYGRRQGTEGDQSKPLVPRKRPVFLKGVRGRAHISAL
jgi:hypothetical protein